MADKTIDVDGSPVSGLIYGIQQNRSDVAARAGINIGRGVIGGVAGIFLPKPATNLIDDGLKVASDYGLGAAGVNPSESTDEKAPTIKMGEPNPAKVEADKPVVAISKTIENVPPATYDRELNHVK